MKAKRIRGKTQKAEVPIDRRPVFGIRIYGGVIKRLEAKKQANEIHWPDEM